MWVFFWIPILSIVGERPSLCQNQTIYLNESWSSWHLLPPGKFYLDSGCTFTFVYPNDTALCGQFYPGEQWKAPWYSEPFVGTDAFGTTTNISNYRVMACLPPPSYSISIPPRADSSALNRYITLWQKRHCSAKNCSKYHLTKVEPFMKPKPNQTVVVTSDMKPFVIAGNNQTGGQITYNFIGDLTAVYIKASDGWSPYERIALDAESFFLYNKAGQIIGTPASWNNTVQHFTQLIVHVMATHVNENTYKYHGLYAERPGLLAIMTSADLDGLVDPKFIQPNYGAVSTVDASQGETSVTIVDVDILTNSCKHYQLSDFTFTDDVKIIIHDGFPIKTINEDAILHELNATILSPEYVIRLGCTKTLRVLRGSISFYIIEKESLYLSKTGTIKGFMKAEPKALKNKQKMQLSFNCLTRKFCNIIGEITWKNYSPADSQLVLDTVKEDTNEIITLVPSNSSRFEGRGFPVIFSHIDAPYHYDPHNKGKMEFTVHNSSLPTSGSFEFYSTSTASDLTYLMSVDNKKTGQRIVICIFYGLNDDQWHTLNWTLNSHMHQCQTERHNDYTKSWFSDVEEYAIRFDVEEVHRRPDCVRNMRIQGQDVIGCPAGAESLKDFTATATVCGCPTVPESIEQEEMEEDTEEPPTCTCRR